MLGSYHPRSIVIYLLLWFLLALFYNYITHLAIMLGVILLFNYRLDKLNSIIKMSSYILPLVVLIIVINSLFNQNGKELLVTLDIWELTIPIYQEAIISSIAMSIKLIIVLAVFNVFNLLIPAEKLMDIFGERSGSNILLLVIATRLIPDLAARFRSIRQVQKCRGMITQGKGLIDHYRNLGPLLCNLLRAALQMALQMAESMQTRGYGISCKRSVYIKEHFKVNDWVLLIINITVLAMIFLLWMKVDRHFGYLIQQVNDWVTVLPLLLLSLPLLENIVINGRSTR
jgi:energy-coupling factor transport system permease protein